MRKISVLTIVILFALFGCSSQKKMVMEVPFTIKDPSCQDYAAGKEEGGSGFILSLPIIDNKDDVTFEEIFFRGHIMKPSLLQNEKGTTLICKWENKNKQGTPDMVMHADPREEIGNQPPSLLKTEEVEFPFDLEKDEVVIGFRKKGKKKIYYHKMKGVKDKLPLVYPSRPKN